MTVLYIDTETYSSEPITNGAHKYFESFDAEVMIITYAIDNGEVQAIDLTAGDSLAPFLDAVKQSTLYVFHNAAFDLEAFRACLGITFPLDKVHCTMARALAHSFPGGLGALSAVFKLTENKKKEGMSFINLFCKPNSVSGDRANRHTHSDKWASFIDYAKADIKATRELFVILPIRNYIGFEHRLWQLDQVINNRGIQTDTDLIENAVKLLKKAADKNDNKVSALTGGDVENGRQTATLLEHLLSEYGVTLPNLQLATVQRRIADENLPWIVRELLISRTQSARSTGAKYTTLLRGANKDGRIRGTLQFCGASRTGRFSGRRFQPQNLKRPAQNAEGVERTIERIKDGTLLDYDVDVPSAIGDCVRGALIAGPGRKLCIADLSNIEGRALAWLAGEDWKLQAYREFDTGRGHDLYRLAYASSFGVAVDRVGDDERQIGKVSELALGFGGAVNAYALMAKAYGSVDLGLERTLEIVKAWRKANAKIVAAWYAVEKAVKHVLSRRVDVAQVFQCTVMLSGNYLVIVMPSGRALHYYRPEIIDGAIQYQGFNSYTQQWTTIFTYGGKFVENITQALSRDVLVNAFPVLETNGYPIILSVHDEPITEPLDEARYTGQEVARIITTNPAWCTDLPLAAKGFETYRYRKN